MTNEEKLKAMEERRAKYAKRMEALKVEIAGSTVALEREQLEAAYAMTEDAAESTDAKIADLKGRIADGEASAKRKRWFHF